MFRLIAISGSRRSLRGYLRPSSVGSQRVEAFSVYAEKSPITISLWEKRKEHKESHQGAAQTGSSGDKKAPNDSRVDVRYDFGCTAGLKDLYIDSFGNVLMGKLLEDLDALAGNVAFFHCDVATCSQQMILECL